MKGHIQQRSKGSWTIWVDLGRDPETGKRKQQNLTVLKNLMKGDSNERTH